MKTEKFSYKSNRAQALAKASMERSMSKNDARKLLYREGLITKEGKLVQLIKEQPHKKSA